ncbi:Non-heme 11 kDa protein of cytochrome bc1 complex [Pseudovirgaria hyperparasitica]|uniref:Cytochrome b-c1 complex subunit 6, mitochondrial n=1 Tax=Pseudovirgaria hyperparasitica TaxID=470096 RepID=A0A6A6VWV7_9PEZI|nr:Non-heme 11 kDa protein of cytochrome bc1 complex [Pseudovirgaria hyperparasitica]KAF2754703.1 Non-heme 11 kDa protein of cytochrome bc1 complex [Pseudovirgaria hyperparasitica]
MGITDFFSTVYDGVSTAFSSTELYAEAPTGGVDSKSPASGTDEEGEEESEANKADEEKAKARTADDDEPEQADGKSGDDEESEEGGEDGGEDEAEEEEEEEEEEDEPEDPMPKITEQCAESKECAPAKHHFDECAERVQGKIEADGKSDEDCVEEFFHLAHCASQCAAPKLFRQLK